MDTDSKNGHQKQRKSEVFRPFGFLYILMSYRNKSLKIVYCERMNVMHNKILRNGEYIRRLKDTIYERYGIVAAEITSANSGYYGETWKVSADSGCYFLKMDYLSFHQKRFRQGLSVVRVSM